MNPSKPTKRDLADRLRDVEATTEDDLHDDPCRGLVESLGLDYDQIKDKHGDDVGPVLERSILNAVADIRQQDRQTED